MTVDNFDLIFKYLKFDRNNDFYFVQIIKRKKDNEPDVTRSAKLVKVYALKFGFDKEKIRKSITETCLLHNARAYINLTPRNFKEIGLKMAQRLIEAVDSDGEDMSYIQNAFNSCCGQHRSRKASKTFLVDIDSKDRTDEVLEYICDMPNHPYELLEVPTVNGVHLITTPFNVVLFNEKFPDIDIHKDNPTILYYSDGTES